MPAELQVPEAEVLAGGKRFRSQTSLPDHPEGGGLPLQVPAEEVGAEVRPVRLVKREIEDGVEPRLSDRTPPLDLFKNPFLVSFMTVTLLLIANLFTMKRVWLQVVSSLLS